MERRTREGYRLRIYIDAIKAVKAMTDAQWVDTQSQRESCGPYMTRLMWLRYLESCALTEAEHMLPSEAA